MSDENMRHWEALKTPPPEALKPIKGGRLKGMTDISPQWRYQALTELFGPCGVGWKYEIAKLWADPDNSGLIAVFATIDLFWKDGDNWSDPIPGIGGSMFVAKESSGPYTTDEAYKMAVTDALGVAAKMLGVASDVYMGNMDGSKHRNAEISPKCPKCGKDKDVIPGKEEYGGGWLCWKKNGGCGHKWKTKEEKFATAEEYNALSNAMQNCTNQTALDKWVADNLAKINKLGKTDLARLKASKESMITIFKGEPDGK